MEAATSLNMQDSLLGHFLLAWHPRPALSIFGWSPAHGFFSLFALHDIDERQGDPALRGRGFLQYAPLSAAETEIVPVIDAGLAGKTGSQIGAGILKAPPQCFEKACKVNTKRYGT